MGLLYTMAEWAEYFRDETRKLSLEELSAMELMHHCQLLGDIYRKLDKVDGRANRLEIAAITGEYPMSQDDSRYEAVQQLIKDVEAKRVVELREFSKKLARTNP